MNVILTSKEGKVRTFWTTAKEDMINHIIKECSGRYDMIMNWDKKNITHNLDWVSYHLRRFGYMIKEYKPQVYSKTFLNVPEMNVRKIKK